SVLLSPALPPTKIASERSQPLRMVATSALRKYESYAVPAATGPVVMVLSAHSRESAVCSQLGGWVSAPWAAHHAWSGRPKRRASQNTSGGWGAPLAES